MGVRSVSGLQINFAVKHDQPLGKECLALLRADTGARTPFGLALLFSLARISWLEEPVSMTCLPPGTRTNTWCWRTTTASCGSAWNPNAYAAVPLQIGRHLAGHTGFQACQSGGG